MSERNGVRGAVAGRLFSRTWDVWVAAGLTLAGALAVVLEPAGSRLRLAVTAPVLLFTPGYLLLQAVFVPPPVRSQRAPYLFFAVVLSPALVGLAALSTAMAPSGFQPAPIVAVTTALGLFPAAIAIYRRARLLALEETAKRYAVMPVAEPVIAPARAPEESAPVGFVEALEDASAAPGAAVVEARSEAPAIEGIRAH